ncbi:MAG TPA: hypothetical protein VJI73_02450 [Candidatus Paceibacterota bacterium]
MSVNILDLSSALLKTLLPSITTGQPKGYKFGDIINHMQKIGPWIIITLAIVGVEMLFESAVRVPPEPSQNYIIDNGVVSVSGRVSLGPICPLEHDPPDPACADRPVHTTVNLYWTLSSNSAPYASAETNKDGYYSFGQPRHSGQFYVETVEGDLLPSCPKSDPFALELGAQPKVVNISCDSGIR